MNTTTSKTANKGSIAALLKKSKVKKSLNNSANNSETIPQIELSIIKPHPDQPRKTFNEVDLGELSDSIKQHGVLEPIIILPLQDGFHYLAAGERRWRASKIAGKEHIPAIIKDIPVDKLLAIQLIENIQREDIPALEEADAVHTLSKNLGSQKEVCTILGKPKDYVSKMCTVAVLPDYARQAFNDEIIKDVESLNHVSRIQKINDGWARKLVMIATERGRITRKYSAAMLKRAKDESLCPVTPEEWATPTPEPKEDLTAGSEQGEQVQASPASGSEPTSISLEKNTNINDTDSTELETFTESSGTQEASGTAPLPDYTQATPQNVVIEVSVPSMQISGDAVIDLKRVSDNPDIVWVIHDGNNIKVIASAIEIKKVRLNQ